MLLGKIVSALAVAVTAVLAQNQNVNQPSREDIAAAPAPAATGIAGKAPNGNSVLILSTTMGVEADVATTAGFTPVVLDPTEWAKMKSSDFASYRAIVLGDQFCTGSAAVAAAEANVNAWGSVVKGNVIIAGTDPSYHTRYGSNADGARKFTESSIRFAADNNAGVVGAYVSLSCYGEMIPVKALAGLGGTFSTKWVSTCDGNESVVKNYPGTPLDGLTSANIRGWFCSAHEWFTSPIPAGYETFATVDDPTAGKVPYILVKPVPKDCCKGLYTGSSCCVGKTGQINVCVNQVGQYMTKCGGEVPTCQDYSLGTANGLKIQSSVCNV